MFGDLEKIKKHLSTKVFVLYEKGKGYLSQEKCWVTWKGLKTSHLECIYSMTKKKKLYLKKVKEHPSRVHILCGKEKGCLSRQERSVIRKRLRTAHLECIHSVTKRKRVSIARKASGNLEKVRKHRSTGVRVFGEKEKGPLSRGNCSVIRKRLRSAL